MQPASLRRAVLWTLTAAFLTLSYWIATPPINHGVGGMVHVAILDRWGAAPFSWRVLIPLTINLFVPLTDFTAILWSIAFLSIFLTAVALIALFAWLRKWVSEARAWIGVGIAAALAPLMYASYVNSANLPLEVILILIGLLMRDRHNWRFAALVVVAMLNRETGVYLVVLYALLPDMQPRWLLRCLLAGLLAFALVNAVFSATWYWGGALDFLGDPAYLLTALVYQMPFLCLFALAQGNRKAAHPALRRIVAVADERPAGGAGPGWLEREIVRLTALIRESAHADPSKVWSNDRFEQEVAWMARFARQRGREVVEQAR